MAEPVAPYRQIVQDVRRRIESGELGPGDRVPSARQLTREWGVAIATATKAHAALREAGITVARPGVGTVVAGAGPRHDHELTRERIVAAAVVIADTEGIAELSMRRIARTLGVSTMSLYRHVQGKEELVVAMIDATLAGLSLPRRPPHWRAALELVARLEWQLFQRHPWLATTMSLTRPQPAPGAMRVSEWVLAALDGTRLSLPDRLYVQILLFGFVRGLAGAIEPETEAVRDSGVTSDQWVESQTPVLRAVLDGDAMPHLRDLAQQPFDFSLDQLFEFGLARLLDGLATFVDRAGRPQAGPPVAGGGAAVSRRGARSR